MTQYPLALALGLSSLFRGDWLVACAWLLVGFVARSTAARVGPPGGHRVWGSGETGPVTPPLLAGLCWHLPSVDVLSSAIDIGRRVESGEGGESAKERKTENEKENMGKENAL